jgi:hypothetical protein
MPSRIMQKILKSLVNELDRDDASSTSQNCKKYLMINELRVLKTNLAYIHVNFSFLSQTRTKLEKNTNLLSEIIKEINAKLNESRAWKMML